MVIGSRDLPSAETIFISLVAFRAPACSVMPTLAADALPRATTDRSRVREGEPSNCDPL